MASVDPDLALLQAAITRAQELSSAYNDLVPLNAIREGFWFRGQRISFGSSIRGIYRARQMHGRAALSLVAKPPKVGRSRSYEDELDVDRGVILYHYRAGSADQPDNQALQAAHDLQTPLVYFHRIAPSQYPIVAPVFVRENDRNEKVVLLEAGLPLADTQPGGPASTPDMRRYALPRSRSVSTSKSSGSESFGLTASAA